MTYSPYKFLLLTLLSLTCLPSFNCYAVETERITQLIDFITENSSLKYNESMGLPKVIAATPDYLQTLAFTEVQVAEAKKSGIALPEVTGYFDRYTKPFMCRKSSRWILTKVTLHWFTSSSIFYN